MRGVYALTGTNDINTMTSARYHKWLYIIMPMMEKEP